MRFLPVPKFMQWQPSLDQRFVTTKSTLITSGCSFTSSTGQLESAASWPGYVKDRCRFEKVLDYSYPGVGNEYIGDSILHFFSQVPDSAVNQYMAIIMWSGLDRKMEKISSNTMPCLNGISYRRQQDSLMIDQQEKNQRAQISANKIIEVYEYLERRQIAFVFTMYANLLFAPYIPKRDTTFEFDRHVPKHLLEKLKKIDWVPKNPMEFLYEYAFANDYLNQGDGFHPPIECNLKWTDEVLLPAMSNLKLIESL